jgi:hypothetical protein
MFYSTRYFFRLAGLLLAAYLVYSHFPDILRGLRGMGEYIGRFFSRYTPDTMAAIIYNALSSVIRGAK